MGAPKGRPTRPDGRVVTSSPAAPVITSGAGRLFFKREEIRRKRGKIRRKTEEIGLIMGKIWMIMEEIKETRDSGEK